MKITISIFILTYLTNYSIISLGSERMNTRSIIKNIILSHKKLIFGLLFIILFSISLKIATPLIMRNLINDIVTDGVAETSKLIIFSAMVLMFFIFSFILDAQRESKTITFGLDISSELNQKAYATILYSEVQELKKNNKEAMLDKIKTKAHTIGNDYVSGNVIPFIYNTLLVLSLSITLLIVNYWFFLVNLVALPIYYLVCRQINNMLVKRQEKTIRSNENHTRYLEESLTQVKNIKILNGIKAEEDKNSKLLRKVERSYLKEKSLTIISKDLINPFFFDLIITALIWIGGAIILQNQDYRVVGSVITYVIVVPQILKSVRNLVSLKVFPSNVTSELDALDEIFNLRPENRADTVQQLDEIYSLKFKDVNFDYEKNGKFNLDNINFEIKKGEKLGILGLSSSGKTTIADLLTKIVRPKQGSILINNCDLNKVNSYYLRNLIAVVPQNFKLIRGTIENNITYPHPFDEYKYNDALNKCRLKQVITNLDKRDQTLVSDDTTLLTVPEKQKIALANAFYKDAKIFLLDEATSKLDQNSENEIMNEIYKLKNKIIIVISNRIYNLSKCDKILILNNGRIIEYGKATELLEDSRSTFARMMNEYEQTKIRVTS